jgi:predicted nucleic-acid-binding Zn-ribbon protein
LSEVKKCPKCGGEMEIGAITGYGMANVGFKSGEKKTLRVVPKMNYTKAYSCKVCGYIEIYRKIRGN